eukprot:7183693-Pyramimonas_sp.AAC.1
MQGEMLARMKVQAEMMAEVKATGHKVESVVNSLCPRGNSHRRRGGNALGTSARTGSLQPYNQHISASSDLEQGAGHTSQQ